MVRSNSCQECSPAKPEEKALRPIISFCLRSDGGCMTIGKDVIRALGNPKYITFLVNWERLSIAILECHPRNNMSFMVPDYYSSDVKFRIHSKPFVTQVSEACNLPFDRATRFKGVYNLEKKAVIFDLLQGNDEIKADPSIGGINQGNQKVVKGFT